MSTELNAAVAAPRRKVIAKRSLVWKHFDSIGVKQFKCKHCQKQYTQVDSSTTKMMRHLRHKHASSLETSQTEITQFTSTIAAGRSVDFLVDLICGSLLPFSIVEGILLAIT